MNGNGIIGKNESFWSRTVWVLSVVTIGYLFRRVWSVQFNKAKGYQMIFNQRIQEWQLKPKEGDDNSNNDYCHSTITISYYYHRHHVTIIF